MSHPAFANVIKLLDKVETHLTDLNFSRCNQNSTNELATRCLDLTRLIWDKAAHAKAAQETERRQKYDEAIGGKIEALRLGKQTVHKALIEKNIEMVFVSGPQDEDNDTDNVKKRKATTRHRCEVIAGLAPRQQLLWIVALSPGSWTAGTMSNEMFEGLVDTLQKQDINWTPPVKGFLQEVGNKFTALQDSPSYNLLMRYDENLVATDPLPPSRENREVNDMFTNSPYSMIHLFQEPLRTIITNSRQWKWERSQGLATTGCWASLFPKHFPQDFGFMIWGGYIDGYELNNQLDMRHVGSSAQTF